MEQKRRALRQEALSQVLSGEATIAKKGGSSVVKLDGKGRKGKQDRYVELSREKTDKIFMVLAEFGTQRDPAYPDQDTDPVTPGPSTFEGPLHNAIPAPDRAVDNSTVWQANYSPAYYRNLYFGTGKNVDSLKTCYETQSPGRYSVDGLLVSYWDTSQTDNNVSAHPGQGLSLSVDSHPKPILRADGTPWRNRIPLYDAPFSLKRADSFTLHVAGVPSRITGLPAQPVFDDTKNYFDPTAPGAGVKLPAAGVTIKVEDVTGTSIKVKFGKSRTS